MCNLWDCVSVCVSACMEWIWEIKTPAFNDAPFVFARVQRRNASSIPTGVLARGRLRPVDLLHLPLEPTSPSYVRRLGHRPGITTPRSFAFARLRNGVACKLFRVLQIGPSALSSTPASYAANRLIKLRVAERREPGARPTLQVKWNCMRWLKCTCTESRNINGGFRAQTFVTGLPHRICICN